jgi:succinyl-CoA synthetase alpha subunit
MGHAGAIVTGNRGSGQSKVSALTRAGATVIDVPGQVADALHGLRVPSGFVEAHFGQEVRSS